jgi:predicted nuclease of predicted toxin-antitoxin system
LRLWIDAQLPPSLAVRLRSTFPVQATHVFELGFVDANDQAIFDAARGAGAIVVTKDADFVRLLETHGPPPQVLWVTIGNANNADLWKALEAAWPEAGAHFDAGEPLVEINRARS